MHHVVVEDPSGEYWEGGLVESEVAAVLRSRGVCTLPIEPTLVRRSAVGGYFRRSWGAGWSVGTQTVQMHCPLVLFVARGDDNRSLHWAARLVPESADVAGVTGRGGKLTGILRLTGDSGQPGTRSGGFVPSERSAFDCSTLGRPDERGGWTVYGDAQMLAPDDQMFGCGLYGSAPGLRVAWAAVSQSR
jgi:hypothetical protein